MAMPSRVRRRAPLCTAIAVLFSLGALLTAGRVGADTLSGTVKDSSGAVVPGAKVEIARAVISYSPLLAGERVMKFALLPNLRVARVTGDDGKELEFIQEDRNAVAANVVVRRHDRVVARRSAREMFKLGFIGSCALTTAPILLALIVLLIITFSHQR